MSHYNLVRRCLAFSVLMLIAASAAAIPDLQLTIENGTWTNSSPITQTTVANGATFKLYGLLQPSDTCPPGTNKTCLGETFYITAALELGTGDGPVSGPVVNGGSFVFDGVTVNVPTDTVHGTPTGLPTHGDFATWYWVHGFTFDPLDITDAFDAQTTTPTSDLVANPACRHCIYFHPFDVDTTLLGAGYSLHFDLYNVNAAGSVNAVAPFSHDAQSRLGSCREGGCGTPQETVPEPETLWLAAAALVGMAITRRRTRQG